MEETRYQKTNYAQALAKPLFYIAALFIATYAVLKIEKFKPSDLGDYQKIFQKEMLIPKASYYPVTRVAGALSDEDLAHARTAWKYFENNYDKRTGLARGIEGRDAASVNDISSFLMAMISAYELDIIDSLEFHRKMTRTLTSLKRMPLFEGKLPNKYYHTGTMQMLDHAYKTTDTGIGWSAIEVGRFYTVVQKILHRYPQYGSDVKKITSRWKMNEMINDGYLYGIVRTSDSTLHHVQEGTLGYEEYAAKGLMMAGYDVTEALVYTDFLKYVQINEREIGVDTRAIDYSSIPNYLTSEPFILDGLEYGWDVNSRELAYRLYKVQQDRYRETGIVTAVGEVPVDKAPYYVYNCIYAAEEEWSCIDAEGQPVEAMRTISTKNAFGWSVLFNDEYSKVLYTAVKDLHDPAKGWFAGKYEASGRINKVLDAATNGMVLEALNYKRNGRIVKF